MIGDPAPRLVYVAPNEEGVPVVKILPADGPQNELPLSALTAMQYAHAFSQAALDLLKRERELANARANGKG